jgi:hypothetical protein
MRIDKKLHLVIPIYSDDGEIVAYVHSTPLALELVDQYSMVLAQTYAAIFSQGIGLAAGASHAARVLRFVATERGVWFDSPNGTLGVERGLMEEIRRLTMVAALSKEAKWEMIPLHVAIDRGVLNAEDRSEVENAIVFFIVGCSTLRRVQRQGLLGASAELWGAQLTSSPFTEWASSLKTSIATVSSGAKSPATAKEEPARANATVDGKPSRLAF